MGVALWAMSSRSAGAKASNQQKWSFEMASKKNSATHNNT
jgi:hypothetical protein